MKNENKRASLVIKSVFKGHSLKFYYNRTSGKKSDRTFVNAASCFNGWKEYFKKGHAISLVCENDYGVTVEDARKWVGFMNLCGFPCTLEKAENSKHAFEIKMDFDNPKYMNETHMWIAATAIRYLVYAFSGDFPHFPRVATELYAKFPELKAYQCLLLAHHFTLSVAPYWDWGHGMVLNKAFKALTFTEVKKKIKTQVGLQSCNHNCTDYIGYPQATTIINDKKIIELMKKGDYEGAMKIFKNYGII
jgi:hypothetical protein